MAGQFTRDTTRHRHEPSFAFVPRSCHDPDCCSNDAHLSNLLQAFRSVPPKAEAPPAIDFALDRSMMAPHDTGPGSWQPGVAALSPAPAASAGAPPAPAPAPPPAAPSEAGCEEAPPPPPPPQLAVDRAPGKPAAVETSTSAISLQWSPVSCTVISQVPVAVEYVLNYQLQMQQVGGMRGPGLGRSVHVCRCRLCVLGRLRAGSEQGSHSIWPFPKRQYGRRLQFGQACAA